MPDNSTAKMKEIIAFYLSKIKDERFRFNLFFKLNKNQYFLFNIFQSKRGFLPLYKGLQLRSSKSISNAIQDVEEFEKYGDIVSNHPFLYGDLVKNSTLYIKKIFSYYRDIGAFEFVIRKEFVPASIKDILNELTEAIMPYFTDIYEQIKTNVYRRYFSINSLSIIKNARPRTFYHSFRVSDLSVAIALNMGLDKKSIRKLCYASLIHDIGEMYLPRDIFYKEGKLTDEELNEIKQHPKNLRKIFYNNPIMEDIVEIAYYHHERMDGKGYYGFKKSEIPIESRILALSETVDGLYTDRPGRKGFDVNQIITFIKNSAIDVFDEDVVEYAVEIIERFYANREIDISMISNINNIGKSATIIFEKHSKLIFVQGAIEYVSRDIMGIVFYENIDFEFSFGEIVRVQFPLFDIVYDFKASVISFSDMYLNIMIKEKSDSMYSNLNVFWEFDAIAVPLKLSDKILDSKESASKFVKIKTKRFGSKSLTAIIDKSDIKLNIGDTVLIKMKPLNETITIPAVVSNIIDNDNFFLVYFEYFSLSESADARIHQAIYYKQSRQSI